MGTNGPVGFEKNIAYKKCTRLILIILCHLDFREQIEKLVTLLLYTSENCSRKYHACVHFILSV